MDNAELLKELRIERHQRDDHPAGGRGRWPWIVAALLLVLLAAAGGWFWFGHRAVTVQVAQAVSLSADTTTSG